MKNDRIEFLANNLQRVDGFFFWTGESKDIESVRRQLYNHWRRCAGEKRPLDSDIQIYCMHDDANCMDQRYITLDPDSWEAPKKNSKEKSSCEK